MVAVERYRGPVPATRGVVVARVRRRLAACVRSSPQVLGYADFRQNTPVQSTVTIWSAIPRRSRHQDSLTASIDAPVVVDDDEAARRDLRLQVDERADRRLVEVTIEPQDSDLLDRCVG